MITTAVQQLLGQALMVLGDARLMDEVGQVLSPADRERLRQAQLQVIDVRGRIHVYPFEDSPPTG